MYEVVTIVSGSSDVSDEYYDCVDTFEEAKEIFESHCESCENFSAQAEEFNNYFHGSVTIYKNNVKIKRKVY